MAVSGETIERLRAEAKTLIDLAKFELLLASARRDVLRIKVAVARHMDRSQEAPCSRAYNPEQPRVPAGNPHGGEWTNAFAGSLHGNEAETVPADAERVEVAADGHHFVPRAVFGKENLQPETRRVFENEKTGPLLSGRHYFDQPHRNYNEAVRERFNQFLSDRGIRSDQMSPSQAREFSESIRRSSEPRIRDFNYRLYQREIWFRIRYLRLRD